MKAHRFALGTRRLRILGTVSAVAITAALTLTGSSTFAAPLAGSVDPIAAATATPGILAPPDAIVGEGDGAVNFLVRLAEEGTNTVTVHYNTVNATAGGGGGNCDSDFEHTNATLTFTPGQIEKLVPITITDCPGAEPLQSFTLDLDSATGGGVIARASSRISIVDNDTDADSPRLHVRDAVVDEKDKTAFVSVLMGGPNGQSSDSTVTVGYQTASGTATSGSDFDQVSGTLTFDPRDTVLTIPIPILDEDSTEPGESFTLTLSGPNNATLADASATISIGASDATGVLQPAILAPADVIIGEAEGFVDLVVKLAVPGLNTVSVDYTTANGTAGGGNSCSADYVVAAGKLTFAPGETTKVVRVQLIDCFGVEIFRAFTLQLLGQVNSTIRRASTRISIVESDNVVETPRLHVRDAVVDEKDEVALVSVLLGGPTGQASLSTITVNYATGSGSASADSDFTTSSGTLTFAPGETTKTVPVPISDDDDSELSERFTLGLSSPLNADISDGIGDVVIGTSDHQIAAATPRILAPTDMIVGEADGFVDLAVRLSARSLATVSVDYTTQNSTAGGGNSCSASFTVAAGKLIFAPGETTKVVRVQLLECAGAQPFRAFIFELNPAVNGNGTIGRKRGRISIVDRHPVAETPTLHVRDAFVDEKDGVALVSVLLGGPAGQSSLSSVTVDYATGNGSASADSDFTDSSGKLTFAPGETTKTVVIPIVDDGTPEPAENFTLGLSGPTNATIGDGTGLIAIGASDHGEAALPGIFAPADVIVGEHDGYVDLVVRLGEPSANAVSVLYTTVNETAGGGNSCSADYVVTAGELVFAPGETSKVVRVELVPCATVEPTETFRLDLSGSANGVLSRASGRVTILDNTTAPTLASLAVTPEVPSIAAGANQQFTATGTFTDASTADLTGSVSWASANQPVATISAGGLAQGVSGGTSTISATLGSINDSTVLTVVGGQLAQTITFAALGNKTWGDPDFTVSATASSGLTVSFAASGSCTVAGTTVQITGAGSCTITASQSGNATYAAATPVARSFTVAKADQTITFATLGNKTYGDPDFTVSATASSGLTVSFSAGGTCTVSGSTVHITGAGTCTITSSQTGNSNYNAATAVARSFTVAKAGQTINFGVLADRNVGDPDFAVSATASSGLAISLAATGSCTVSGQTVHLTAAGTCTITASQAGNANFNAATPVARSFQVTQSQAAEQTITFAALGNKTWGDPDFTVSATASSGLTVSFSAGGTCTVSGSTVHIVGAGGCLITASQPGNASYLPAASVERPFTVAKAAQTISFPALANRRLGDPDFTVSATASSGLAVSFAAGGACTISGTRVHLTGEGRCTIGASQAGNANYNPATTVARSFTIGPRVRCRVPNVVGKTLARAKALLKQRHCRTGTVTKAFSRTRRSGIVIGQNRRPGRVMAANSKVNLTVSRGRRR